jgi:hypothetical protein
LLVQSVILLLLSPIANRINNSHICACAPLVVAAEAAAAGPLMEVMPIHLLASKLANTFLE